MSGSCSSGATCRHPLENTQDLGKDEMGRHSHQEQMPLDFCFSKPKGFFNVPIQTNESYVPIQINESYCSLIHPGCLPGTGG